MDGEETWKGRRECSAQTNIYNSPGCQQSNRHPSSQRHDVNPRCRKSPKPKGAGDPVGNNGTDTESMNGVREVEPNLLPTKICAGGWEGDVHIPGLGRIKEVLFIPEIPYNVLAIIKLIKGTKIKVLFNNATSNLPMMARSLFYTHHEYHRTSYSQFSNDGVKNGKEEGERMIMLTVILTTLRGIVLRPLKAEDPLSIPSPIIQVIREKGPTMDKDIKIDTPVAKDMM
ncbi:hypothetical protein E2320_002291 [Naja naja]|nr:hypothetical protein E2320_002291 [Naja naja]